MKIKNSAAPVLAALVLSEPGSGTSFLLRCI